MLKNEKKLYLSRAGGKKSREHRKFPRGKVNYYEGTKLSMRDRPGESGWNLKVRDVGAYINYNYIDNLLSKYVGYKWDEVYSNIIHQAKKCHIPKGEFEWYLNRVREATSLKFYYRIKPHYCIIDGYLVKREIENKAKPKRIHKNLYRHNKKLFNTDFGILKGERSIIDIGYAYTNNGKKIRVAICKYGIEGNTQGEYTCVNKRLFGFPWWYKMYHSHKVYTCLGRISEVGRPDCPFFYNHGYVYEIDELGLGEFQIWVKTENLISNPENENINKEELYNKPQIQNKVGSAHINKTSWREPLIRLGTWC